VVLRKVWKKEMIENTAPDGNGLAQGIWHSFNMSIYTKWVCRRKPTLPTSCGIHNNATIMFSNNLQQMKIQPPRAELPNAGMSICAFEICTPNLVFWINIPASASFICYQRPPVRVCGPLCESCILLNGLETIPNGEGRSFEFTQSLGEIMIGLLRENEV
jgi:hypothetical protein